jgi:peroxiredoxin
MKKLISLSVLLAASMSLAVEIGKPAPEFTGKTFDGKTVKLSELKGNLVVLEWHNQNCPYVKKHYDSNNMQKLQAEWRNKGVKWVTVISSAPGSQGYVTPEEEAKYLKEKNASPDAVIMDTDGKIGSAFGAKTTPHMFIVDKAGLLVYNGAIDDKNTSDAEDIPKSKNYVSAALGEAMLGKPVSVASTTPYGCGVKYKK